MSFTPFEFLRSGLDRYIPRPVGYTLDAGSAESVSRGDHVHTIEVEDWKEPVLFNGWVPHTNSLGGFPAQGIRYLRDPMGFIHVEGGISDGNQASSTLLWQMPVGYRPDNRLLQLVSGTASLGGIAVVNFMPNGDVLISQTSTANMFFGGVVFEADRRVPIP